MKSVSLMQKKKSKPFVKIINSVPGPHHWLMRLRFDTKHRKRRKRSTREEEQALLEEQRRNISVTDFFDSKYLPHAKEEKKPDTWESEERLFRLWIKPVIGGLSFHEIAPFHLDKIKSNMRKGKREDTYKHSKPRPLSPKSILHALALVRQIWNHARRGKVVKGDWPGRDVKKPKFDNRRMRFLSREDARNLSNELLKRSQKLHDIALISLHCGLRAKEIFTLRWNYVDFDKKTLLLTDTKNTKTRTAFMTPDVLDMLAQRRTDAAVQSELIFHNTKGEQINEVSSTFARVVDHVGLNTGVSDTRQRVSFHSLRHTFASWLVESGVSLHVVRELLGHETLAMTIRYSHVGESALRGATKLFAEALDAQDGSTPDRKVKTVNLK
jgi:integrase